jgi:hypothetical protein
MRWTVLSCLVALLGATSLLADRAGEATGRIQGALVTATNRVRHVGQAVVFLGDARTGRPLIAATGKPVGEGGQFNSISDLWHATTDPDGSFVFDKVPPGEYRLVAQSWSGTRGLPEQRQTSEVVLLHGVVDQVPVRAGEATSVTIRPLGNGVLTVRNDPEEAGAFLFVSRAPMLGEPVLGFYGWGDGFVRGVVGVTHMAVPRATFVGLPDDRDVHVGVFCYDNVPGFGGASVRVGKDAVARVRLYAGWSNGHDEPSERLRPLVEHLEKENPSLPELMQLGPHAGFLTKGGQLDRRKLWEAARKDFEKTVKVAGVGDFRVIDIMAADAYKGLRAHHRKIRR